MDIHLARCLTIPKYMAVSNSHCPYVRFNVVLSPFLEKQLWVFWSFTTEADPSNERAEEKSVGLWGEGG